MAQHPPPAKPAPQPDRTASSQFVMIVLAFVVALIVLAVWRPWVTSPVHGVRQSVTVTASP